MRIYRPEIDGLRALAVVSVLLYHLDFKMFGGGFVGVDVFFVISGFLITNNILSDIEEEKFRLKNFYLRRLRRLFPALFFTLVFSLLLGCLLLSPEHLKKLGNFIPYAGFFLPNIFLLGESGYFATESIFKPLLHFWSLGIEEQFYLIWPTTLIILSTVRFRFALPIFLILIGGVSLLYAERNIYEYQSQVFYLMHFRLYEFALGAICVCYFKKPIKQILFNEIAFILGLGLILYSVLQYSSATIFPGLNALIPCFGATLIICSSEARIAKKILANPPMIFIGLISYSLYLIHWPVIVYSNYVLNNINIPLAVFLSAALAVLMYYFIETPLRYSKSKLAVSKQEKSKSYGEMRFLWQCISLSILLFSISIYLWKSDGWSWRIPQEKRAVVAFVEKDLELYRKVLRSDDCSYGDTVQHRVTFLESKIERCCGRNVILSIKRKIIT